MKKLGKKIIAMFLCCVFVVGSLVACGSSTASSGGGNGKKLLLAFHDEGSSTIAQFVEAMTAKAQSEGVSVDIVYCEKNASKQKAQIEEANGKYDAIICRLADASTALQMEVAAGDTPIVFINNAPEDDVLKVDKYVYVGSYEYDAGRFQAEYVWNGLGKPSSLNVIILKGQKGHSSVPGRTNAIKYFLKDNNVNVNYVFEDFASWSDTEAYDKLNIFKMTNQSFDCIFANSDKMALGAINWLKDNGYDTSKILVAGIDASEGGCEAIVAGDMHVTIFQDLATQSDVAIESAIALANGKTVTDSEYISKDQKHIYIPYIPVDASNVNQYM